jgi:competence protein ComFB
MNIHNTSEDIVFAALDQICVSIEKQGNPDQLCLCDRCRVDAACFVLNRIPPYYIVSNRGVARIEQEPIKCQQREADASSLLFEALKRVSHNQRPHSSHIKSGTDEGESKNMPVFNIPTIVGRVFNGVNFSPMVDITVELWQDGKLVEMKNQNWQNPYNLEANTQGTFTFWPESIRVDSVNIRKSFKYFIKIDVEGHEPLNHFFEVPVISEQENSDAFSIGRTFKLPDLYIFPPGEDD